MGSGFVAWHRVRAAPSPLSRPLHAPSSRGVFCAISRCLFPQRLQGERGRPSLARGRVRSSSVGRAAPATALACCHGRQRRIHNASAGIYKGMALC